VYTFKVVETTDNDKNIKSLSDIKLKHYEKERDSKPLTSRLGHQLKVFWPVNYLGVI